MRCAHPDWLDNRLTVTGPADDVVAFRQAAAGAGVAGWALDYDRVEEALFLHMLTVSPGPGGVSVAGARHVARQMRDLVWDEHEAALSRVGHDRSCPFDLNALVPVPWEILRLGEDDPAAVAWMWAHWGTTWPLRRVELRELSVRQRRALPASHLGCVIWFWSADWTPRPTIVACRRRWPRVRFAVEVEYWWEVDGASTGRVRLEAGGRVGRAPVTGLPPWPAAPAATATTRRA